MPSSTAASPGVFSGGSGRRGDREIEPQRRVGHIAVSPPRTPRISQRPSHCYPIAHLRGRKFLDGNSRNQGRSTAKASQLSRVGDAVSRAKPRPRRFLVFGEAGVMFHHCHRRGPKTVALDPNGRGSASGPKFTSRSWRLCGFSPDEVRGITVSVRHP